MINVFVPNRHGTDILVRCVRPYYEMELCARVSYLSHLAQIQIFHNISIFAMYLNAKLLFIM